MLLVDCFTFYNEIELLSYRLEILYNIIDYFIIVESTHTFAGYEKGLYFEKNKELFSKYIDKIVHIVVDDFQYKQPNIDFSKNEQWQNEYHQRNSILLGINKLNLHDEDIFTITDVDEIPDPTTLEKIKKNEIEVTVNSLEQDYYYYNLITISNDKWHLTKIIKYKTFKELNKTMDQIRQTNCVRIKNGGWHLGYFGDSQFIANKIKNFSHQELNTNNITDLQNIEERVINSKDLYGRSYIHWKRISILENTYLPPAYELYLKRYISL
jgi:beta-1,4-mannosyl-glycoprotein beta-1,4-N-acetylglucosaminyltransferase